MVNNVFWRSAIASVLLIGTPPALATLIDDEVTLTQTFTCCGDLFGPSSAMISDPGVEFLFSHSIHDWAVDFSGSDGHTLTVSVIRDGSMFLSTDPGVFQLDGLDWGTTVDGFITDVTLLSSNWTTTALAGFTDHSITINSGEFTPSDFGAGDTLSAVFLISASPHLTVPEPPMLGIFAMGVFMLSWVKQRSTKST